jgi:outer membrane protein OmpA-like peptidoglycan-associated protein
VNDIVEIMKNHPEITLVEIEGFTDGKGPVATNVALSLARAKAVMAAVAAEGVDAKRMRAMGFGPYCPIDADDTEAGRVRNRRIELRILNTKDGPTGETTGCPEAQAHGLVSP